MSVSCQLHVSLLQHDATGLRTRRADDRVCSVGFVLLHVGLKLVVCWFVRWVCKWAGYSCSMYRGGVNIFMSILYQLYVRTTEAAQARLLLRRRNGAPTQAADAA